MVFHADNPFQEIEEATMLISRPLVEANVTRILAKTDRQGIRFRPHVKTHQHPEVGHWLRLMGIQAITVSSVEMAEAFHREGWMDITIAIPVNLRQLDRLDRLAAQCRLHVIVDHPATLTALERIRADIHVWIELDTGAGRTGIPVGQEADIARLWQQGQTMPGIRMEGLLWHDGQFYHATHQNIQDTWKSNLNRLAALKDRLSTVGPTPALSAGDTPSTTLLDDLSGVNEIRAGNLVYYDLMQARAGICQVEQIAVALAAPVIGHYPHRAQIAVHAGAVHLSKEQLPLDDRQPVFGRMVMLTPEGWTIPDHSAWVTHLSQEHGLIDVPPEYHRHYPIGSLIGILPVHSCLTADAMKGRNHLLI